MSQMGSSLETENSRLVVVKGWAMGNDSQWVWGTLEGEPILKLTGDGCTTL